MTETWSGFIFADPVAAATPNAVATISPSTADATESFMIPPSVPCASSQVEAPPSARCSYLASPSVMAITDWSNRHGLDSRAKSPHLSAMLLRSVGPRLKDSSSLVYPAPPIGRPVEAFVADRSGHV